jgi:molybdate transport system regulatory protein
MRLRFKIWLDNDGKAFGEGPYCLLKTIQRMGSLNRAISEIGISYRKAWSILNAAERRLGFALVERKVGGTSGGGTHLTPAGRAFVDQYEQFRQAAGKALDSLYQEYFPESGGVVK